MVLVFVSVAAAGHQQDSRNLRAIHGLVDEDGVHDTQKQTDIPFRRLVLQECLGDGEQPGHGNV